MMYTFNCLRWHLGERHKLKTPEYFWWSCKAVDELLVCVNRLLAASPRPGSPKAFWGFLLCRPYSTRKQSICMDGLEENTVHSHTPVQNSTELDLGIGNLISTWWNKTYRQANKSLMGTWSYFVIFSDKQYSLEKVGVHPPLAEL